MNARILAAALAFALVAPPALADEPGREAPLVSGYDAPAECPDAAAFAASVRGELSRRDPSRAQPLQVRVAIVHDERGYSASATASDEQGKALERTVQAPTCAEVVDIAAALVGLAQSDSNAGDAATVTPGSSPPSPATPAGEIGQGSWLSYSIALGYGSFAAGPANPVVVRGGQQTTFNPAQGARLGIGVSHAFGWWRPSLEVSAAYYRQGTTTVSAPNQPMALNNVPLSPTSPTDISDRDVLHATIDACPVHLAYRFLSLAPCATFSMLQSRGNSGNDPGLETGLGGSLRLRGEFARAFFVEALGGAVGVTSSYEPPSAGARMFYAVSLGTTIR